MNLAEILQRGLIGPFGGKDLTRITHAGWVFLLIVQVWHAYPSRWVLGGGAGSPRSDGGWRTGTFSGATWPDLKCRHRLRTAIVTVWRLDLVEFRRFRIRATLAQ